MQYEILRDMLLIVVGAIAVFSALIGGFVFFVLRAALHRDITTNVNKRLDRECRKVRAMADVQLGVTYWIQKSYDRAIKTTQRAIEDAEDVLDEAKTIFAKSNLGFYYAESHKQQPIWHRKEEAIALAKIGFEKYSPSVSEFKEPDWIDNYVFVKAMFVQTNKERDDVIQLVDSMLLRADLEPVHDYLKESKAYVSELRLKS